MLTIDTSTCSKDLIIKIGSQDGVFVLLIISIYMISVSFILGCFHF